MCPVRSPRHTHKGKHHKCTQKKDNKKNQTNRTEQVRRIRVLTVALLCKDNTEQSQTQKCICANKPKRKHLFTVLSVRVLRHKKRESIHKRKSENCERLRGVQVHIYTYGIYIFIYIYTHVHMYIHRYIYIDIQTYTYM